MEVKVRRTGGEGGGRGVYRECPTKRYHGATAQCCQTWYNCTRFGTFLTMLVPWYYIAENIINLVQFEYLVQFLVQFSKNLIMFDLNVKANTGKYRHIVSTVLSTRNIMLVMLENLIRLHFKTSSLFYY